MHTALAIALIVVACVHGCVHSRDFEQTLASKWELRRRVALPNWGNTVYSLMIWHRKLKGQPTGGGAKAGLDALPCNGCGKPAVRRCRFCRAFSYCSQGCCESDHKVHTRGHLFRGICFPPTGATRPLPPPPLCCRTCYHPYHRPSCCSASYPAPRHTTTGPSNDRCPLDQFRSGIWRARLPTPIVTSSDLLSCTRNPSDPHATTIASS